MRPFTTKHLLHLMFIPSFPSPTSALSTVFPSQQFGCQYSSHTYGTYIYFTSPNDTNFSFAIHTTWKQYYPIALRAALVLADFRLADAPREDDKHAMCGWQTLDSVSIKGWDRGDLAAKYLSPSRSSLSTQLTPEYVPTNPSSLLAHPKQRDMRLSTITAPPRTPPHQPHPNAETLARVHQILLTNYPGADIAMFILEMASTIFWAVALTLSLVYLLSYVTRHAELRKMRKEELRLQQPQQQRQEQSDGGNGDGDEDEGIELASLRRGKSEAWIVPAMRKLSFPKPCLGARKGGRGVQTTTVQREASLSGATLRDA
ncbi:hypothetical protein DM02DRAFT_284533 [Periconia macrospinosa]|uniref:Uncharacterized protein n=1 Tax=Periconia macrospinosa TaxID=97972 RepID=A0A2V1EE78_9PLEO|nr:hypothetical protein DM02DRAFT_284533 [Periconia macrospinosa]